MPPSLNVISISPSNVPAVSNVPVGKSVVTTPPEALDIEHVKVFLTVKEPSSLIFSFIVAPTRFIGAQVAAFCGSRTDPATAWLASRIVIVNNGKVSPTTN